MAQRKHLCTAPECTSWAPGRICLCLTVHRSETACRAQGPGPPSSVGSSPAGTRPQAWASSPERAATAESEDSPTPGEMWQCSWTAWSLVHGRGHSCSWATLHGIMPRSGGGDEGAAPHMPWSLSHKRWWMLSVCTAGPFKIKLTIIGRTTSYVNYY